jgi:hypothetical protein
MKSTSLGDVACGDEVTCTSTLALDLHHTTQLTTSGVVTSALDVRLSETTVVSALGFHGRLIIARLAVSLRRQGS